MRKWYRRHRLPIHILIEATHTITPHPLPSFSGIAAGSLNCLICQVDKGTYEMDQIQPSKTKSPLRSNLKTIFRR
jgi:hypothetical protein